MDGSESVVEVFARLHKKASDLIEEYMGGDEPDEVSALMDQIERNANDLDARKRLSLSLVALQNMIIKGGQELYGMMKNFRQ